MSPAGVIEEASDAFLDVPLCVFFPFVQVQITTVPTLIALAWEEHMSFDLTGSVREPQLILSIPISIFCVLACFTMLSLRGTDPVSGLPDYPNINLTYGDYVMPEWFDPADGTGPPLQRVPLKLLLAYQLFGWLWTCWFFASVQFTSVAGAVASWCLLRQLDLRFDWCLTVRSVNFNCDMFMYGQVFHTRGRGRSQAPQSYPAHVIDDSLRQVPSGHDGCGLVHDGNSADGEICRSVCYLSDSGAVAREQIDPALG